jgi:hypothetical protein
MSYQRLVFFGDSWTYGDATNSGCDISEYDQKPFVGKIYDNYPSVLGKKLGKTVLNLAIPGNCNRSIHTQIIESHASELINPKNDLVIVGLSAWSRDFEWSPESELVNVWKRIFPHLKNFYVTKNLWGKFDNLKDDIELAYQTLIDFIGISSFLRSRNYEFYLGTVFELDPVFLHSPLSSDYFSAEKRFLSRPFIDFTKGRFFRNKIPGHPNVIEHLAYAEYIEKSIKKYENITQ